VGLTERDLVVLKEIGRWRFMLSRHIKCLCDFPSARTADRRIKALVDAGYVARQSVLYGVPRIYTLTSKGKALLGLSRTPDKIRTERILHDIAVLDSVCYFMQKFYLPLEQVKTEKELHREDGFSNRKHHPDYVISYDGKIYAVEVELTPKARGRMEKNIESNYLNYDCQIWVIQGGDKIERILNENKDTYPNISIQYIEAMKNA